MGILGYRLEKRKETKAKSNLFCIQSGQEVESRESREKRRDGWQTNE